MIRPILYGLAPAVRGIILITVNCVVPSGAAGCKWTIVTAERACGRNSAFSLRIADRVAARKRCKNGTNCGDETCEITGLGS
jgi:hypothetical protein